MMTVHDVREEQPLAEAFASYKPDSGTVACWWLGQAGFALSSAGTSLVIDPYLSDSLAIKYHDAEFKHKRMMPIPAFPAEITGLDLILCSHRHSDHMDPGSLPDLMRANPASRIIAPYPSREHVADMGLNMSQINFINVGDTFKYNDVSITAVPAAHELFETDADNNHYYLGYVLQLGDLVIYHSGDCVPYEGQIELLKQYAIDIAMLPINGRDAYRKSRNVPGNFTANEAACLCKDIDAKVMIAHHFDMFSFNTADPELARQQIHSIISEKNLILPKPGIRYDFNK